MCTPMRVSLVPSLLRRIDEQKKREVHQRDEGVGNPADPEADAIRESQVAGILSPAGSQAVRGRGQEAEPVNGLPDERFGNYLLIEQG